MSGINNPLFENIKSNFILEMIFNSLQYRRKLNIIRYNKKLQKRLRKDLNDYIKEDSKIIIEIIPIENKYGKFINLSTSNYYHIYFNDNLEEIRKDYITEEDKVAKIKIVIDYEIKNLFGLFHNIAFIKKINFVKFRRNDIKNIMYMFKNCSSLEELNISNFNTYSITNMAEIFDGCESLKELNLFSWNNNNIKDMSGMFYECKSLKKLNITNFNTSYITNMAQMFYGCSSLKELNLSDFNTTNVTNMTEMFYGCESLKKLDLSNFNTTNVSR